MEEHPEHSPSGHDTESASSKEANGVEVQGRRRFAAKVAAILGGAAVTTGVASALRSDNGLLLKSKIVERINVDLADIVEASCYQRGTTGDMYTKGYGGPCDT